MRPTAECIYEFGEFRLDPQARILWCGSMAADVTPKAIEVLIVLVENAGRLVTKEELFRRVWTNSFVEEANLTHHIFRLRKVLGETEEHRFIETIPRRGYRFAANVNQLNTSHADRRQYRDKRYIAYLSLTLVSVLAVALIAWFKLGASPTETRAQRFETEPRSAMSIIRISNSGKAAGPTISPDGKFIAYVSYVYGNPSLVIRQTDVNLETELVPPAERVIGTAAFSPDSASIYYVVFDKADPEGALYRISILGDAPKRVLGHMASMFTLSRDGLSAAFYRDDADAKGTQLIVASMDGSGREHTVLTLRDDEVTASGPPAFSPDGKLLALALTDGPFTPGAQNLAFFTCDLSGAITRLTSETWTEVGMINWLPDGSGIVFVGNRPQIGNQMYLLSYPSGDVRRITKELGSYGNYGMGITSDGSTMVADMWENSAQLWRIDGDGTTDRAVQLTSGESEGWRGVAGFPNGEIVYSSRTGFDYDLWTLNDADGKREGRPLTSDAFRDIEVATSPDGKFVVFVSDRGGGQHLFRIDADGSNLRQLTSGDSFDSKPDISPDSTWIVYASWTNNQSRIWRISAEGGTPVQLTNYDSFAPTISPDSKFIACIFPSGSRAKLARLDIVNSEDGAIVKSFEVIPFDYNYQPARWTPAGDALVFRKMDGNIIGNLYRQYVAGGEPKQFTGFGSQMLFNYAFSRNGKHLILARGDTKITVVMLKHFN